ncbi:MAG: hypothetical protein OJI67_00975 [Prosthecobacter sp.]|nr:hypothetical protein [Prosthecobacter sp.]
MNDFVEHNPLADAIKQGLLRNDVYVITVGVGEEILYRRTYQTMEEVHQYIDAVNDANPHHWVQCKRLRDHRIVRDLLDRINHQESPNPFGLFTASYAEWRRIQANLL